jgi:hypothetical protein
MIKIKRLIKESMTVSIADEDYSRYDNMLDLASHLETLAYRIISSLPPDQLSYFAKNRPAELLVVDGESDIYSRTGTLNLYYSGYTSETLKKILRVVIKRLRELGVKWGKIKQEKSGKFVYQVIRIPIINNPVEPNNIPELNMSNRNAYHIFKHVLGYTADDEYDSSFSCKASELKTRIERVLNRLDGWIEDREIAKDDSHIPDDEKADKLDNPHDMKAPYGLTGARIINMGLSADDIRNRLKKLLEIADWAIKHNKQNIFVA